MVMQDLEKTKAILCELKGLRIAIAIDDFGTGHSRWPISSASRSIT